MTRDSTEPSVCTELIPHGCVLMDAFYVRLPLPVHLGNSPSLVPLNICPPPRRASASAQILTL